MAPQRQAADGEAFFRDWPLQLLISSASAPLSDHKGSGASGKRHATACIRIFADFMSRAGGAPNICPYSRVNCDRLS